MILTALGAIVSRNSIAIMACVALVGWAAMGVKKHDQHVARAAVDQIKDQSRAKIQTARKAQRRIVPGSGHRVLNDRYCDDCPGR